ncbi:alpha/beta fold hydrolase [Adhaeribacter aquaticus]|uniref:alpha/beta fold hydrolase n=1 Tax=Adhaeribacter aquaticus TaxID=299567 RepID=UPI0003F73334|nr:alpha/beta hydrolase [Adhaeribacter aquaticus]
MSNIFKNIVSDSGGNGKPIIFLHGFCESKKVWEQFIEPFKPEFRVVTVDLPGFGQNQDLRDDYSMDSAAAEVHEIVEALGFEKATVIGHSMGGYVALAYAEKYSEFVNGLSLFHSTAFPDSEEKKEARNRTIEFIQKHGVGKFMDSFVAPLFFEGNRKQNEAAINLLIGLGKEASGEAIIGTVIGMRDRPDRTHVLRKANFPIQFIAGKQDTAVPFEQTLQLCPLPKIAHVLLLDQTGHMGMFEQKDITQNAVISFIRSIA